MTLPTQDFLQSIMPAKNGTVDPSDFARRLASLAPGATVSISDTGATLTAGRDSVSVTLPAGVTFATPTVTVKDITTANAPVTQSGKAPTDVTT